MPCLATSLACSDAATANHQTGFLCMRELSRCRATASGGGGGAGEVAWWRGGAAPLGCGRSPSSGVVEDLGQRRQRVCTLAVSAFSLSTIILRLSRWSWCELSRSLCSSCFMTQSTLL